MYFCLFVYLSLKDIFVDICKALLCNGIKHPIIKKKSFPLWLVITNLFCFELPNKPLADLFIHIIFLIYCITKPKCIVPEHIKTSQ